jgi:hypothetical protein
MEDTDKPEVVRPADDVDGGMEWWQGLTHYRVTDLWLFTSEDLSVMAAAFEARGLVVTNRGRWITDTEFFRLPEPQWHWSFQTSCGVCEEGCHCDGTEPTIEAFLSAVEVLYPPARAAWARCSHRVFDVAYDCGIRPHEVHYELSPATLARLAAVNGTLRLTLYPLNPSDIKPA